MKNLGITRKNISFFDLQELIDRAIEVDICKKWWVLVFSVIIRNEKKKLVVSVMVCRFSNNSLDDLRKFLTPLEVVRITPLDFALLH